LGFGSEVWLKYAIASIRNAGPESLLVFYEDFLYDPVAAVKKIADFCGVAYRARASEVAEPALRHSDPSLEDNLRHPEISSDAKIFYLMLLQTKSQPGMLLSLCEALSNRSKTSGALDSDRIRDLEQKLKTQKYLYDRLRRHPYVAFGLWLQRLIGG
jgi:hypothetical protein